MLRPDGLMEFYEATESDLPGYCIMLPRKKRSQSYLPDDCRARSVSKEHAQKVFHRSCGHNEADSTNVRHPEYGMEPYKSTDSC